MSLITWSFPTRILFGVGSVERTGPEARRAGGTRALIVTDKGVVRAGLAEPVEASLRASGLDVAIFDDVLGNPIEKNAHDGARAFHEHKADIVIALGGGSPLDIGKIVRLLVHHHRPLVEYDDAIGGDAHITSNVPPMIAIPTTAGTGSEVGRSGVVTLDQNHRKTVIFSPYLLANAAILDPAMTRGLPPFFTAATGYDALTHCLEAYVSKGDHPMADGIALEGIRLVARYLERAVTHGDDLEARGGMMKAAMMGAVAFQKGLGAAHSLAHPLSSEHDLHHGLANALVLPAVVDFNASVVADRLTDVAHILGGAGSAEGCAIALRDLRARIGLPGTLSAAKVPETNLSKLADLAFVDACHQSNPRACSRDDLLALYRASF
jgi:alcohol dehydrogenase class IV